MTIDILRPEDLEVPTSPPAGLVTAVEHNLVDLTPWHIMNRDRALTRLRGLRQRYRQRYVPFANRQDNDDVAVTLIGVPDRVVVIHDFAEEGWEVRAEYPSFWDWFRAAVEDMIEFESLV